MKQYPFGWGFTIDRFPGEMRWREKIFLDYRENPRKYIKKYTIEEEFGENQSSPRWEYLIERKKETDMFKEILRKGFEEYLQKHNR